MRWTRKTWHSARRQVARMDLLRLLSQIRQVRKLTCRLCNFMLPGSQIPARLGCVDARFLAVGETMTTSIGSRRLSTAKMGARGVHLRSGGAPARAPEHRPGSEDVEWPG